MQASSSRLSARSTATQALGEVSLRGRRAIVTGASSGIGIETARVLAQAGADTLLAVRDVARGEAVAAALRAALPKNAGVLSVDELELADLRSVERFGRQHAERPLDLLINNAGVMATPLGFTAQGLEQQVGINHVGHFALTRALMPALATATAPRVVTVSSDLHKRGRAERLLETLERDPRFEHRRYQRFDAYGDSKLANVLFARALGRRLPVGAVSLALHPGVIPTNLTRSMGALGAVYRALGKLFLKSVEQGAATSIYAASAPELASQSGAYLVDCAVAPSSESARDAELAERLWQSTERLM
jgi:NAD(P)-dependent dehydrogenase (short-subunit alcohol dehydrogenase family)